MIDQPLPYIIEFPFHPEQEVWFIAANRIPIRAKIAGIHFSLTQAKKGGGFYRNVEYLLHPLHSPNANRVTVYADGIYTSLDAAMDSLRAEALRANKIDADTHTTPE